MKYIVMSVKGVESIFTFPSTIDHDRMHEAITMIRFGHGHHWDRELRGDFPISAGFVQDGRCFGHSETLSLKSRGQADTVLLKGVS